jgi:hypothetical protein
VRPKHGVRARCSIRFITFTPSRTSNRKAVVIEVDGVCHVCDLYNFLFLGPLYMFHIRLTVRIAATLTSLPRGSMQSQEKRFPLLRSVISASGVSLPGLTSSFYVRSSLLHIPQTPLPPVLRAPFPLKLCFRSLHSCHCHSSIHSGNRGNRKRSNRRARSSYTRIDRIDQLPYSDFGNSVPYTSYPDCALDAAPPIRSNPH